MLKELFYKRKLGIPWIAIILILTCSIVSLATFLNRDLYRIFSFTTKPLYWWQYFTGVFEHSIYLPWFFWAHYLGNMSVILLFGVFVERVLGSKRMFLITLTSGVISCISFQLLNRGEYCTGSGVSGIAWAYAPIAFYILIQIYQYDKKKIRKEILFYIMVFEFFFIWFFITIVSTWKETNAYHVIATFVGLLFLFPCRKTIQKQLTNFFKNQSIVNIKRKPVDKFIICVYLIVPLCMLIIIGLYQTNRLERIYTEVVSITPCNSLEEINENNGKIEILFDAPVINVPYTRTTTPGEGIIQLEISYSNDRKTMIVSFDQSVLEEPTGTITLKNITLENGRVVESVKIEF